MSNFGLPEYDQHREWIRNARNRNMKWEEIDYAGRGNDEGLSEFLTQQSLLNFWKEVSCSEWKELVHLQKEAEEQTVKAPRPAHEYRHLPDILERHGDKKQHQVRDGF